MTGVLKVAVSQRVDVWPDRGERRDALDQRLVQWLAVAGCSAVPVPNAPGPPGAGAGAASTRSWLAAIEPGAVVLSGGNDIGEVPERDETETLLLNYARDNQLPLLGICRGMQMMIVWAGGRLAAVTGHVATRHPLHREAGAAGRWPDEVNSYHARCVAEMPPGFSVAARSGDGAIEAVRHAELPWEGWMWHPEREARICTAGIMRFQALLEAGARS